VDSLEAAEEVSKGAEDDPDTARVDLVEACGAGASAVSRNGIEGAVASP
jgi:hypothetical protein